MAMTDKREHVSCSTCGKRVSGIDPELGLVVRAFVECPECIGRTMTLSERRACINCTRQFDQRDVRHFYGAPDAQVGPLCDDCDRTIKVHTHFVDRDTLVAALKRAVRTIRMWHGLGMGDREAQAWALYQASPEMTAINAAIQKAEGT